MDLASRITLAGPVASSPEDFLSDALSTLDPDDEPNIHGDADHGLIYTSPHLPKPLALDLADPDADHERRLFSHYLWNASLLLAEFVEAGSLGLDSPGSGPGTLAPKTGPVGVDVRARRVLEVGAGAALPSILSGLLGASRVVATDYPAPPVLKTLRANVARNIVGKNVPGDGELTSQVLVAGHAWGELGVEDPLATESRHAFDIVFAADCLWMPWQHANLLASLSWFLARTADARVWVVAGFHTGREKIADFLDQGKLAASGLEVESIWERDSRGVEREWSVDGEDDVGKRKRWLVVAVLRRTAADLLEAGKEQ